MKTEFLEINFTDNELIDELVYSLLSEGTELILIVIKPCHKADNILFINKLDEGYFQSNLLPELNDKYFNPAIDLLQDAGYKLDLAESNTDIFNTVTEL